MVKIDLTAFKPDGNSKPVETKWVGEKHEFLGEVIFVPRQTTSSSSLPVAEDDGYLLSYIMNGKTKQSFFVIFDAQNILKGPIHRAEIPGVHIPHGLHGSFAPGLVFDYETILRKFTVC